MSHSIAYYCFSVIDILITSSATALVAVTDRWQSLRKPKQEPDNTSPLSTCRYRLDNAESLTFTLPDSRRMSYAIFGSSLPTARTVFFLHGWPGTRIEATYLDEPAQAHDIRIVSVDRPGTGSSTPDPKRTILSHADEIECLAQHLKAEHYGVLGVSGGGPYALACARALPAEKLKVVSIVCGLGPADIGYRGMFFPNYVGWTFGAHYSPRLIQWWFRREPSARFDLSERERFQMMLRGFEKAKSKLPVKDINFFGDPDVMKVQLRNSKEVIAQGSEWMMQDMTLLASDPGFKVDDIRKDLKVQLWYGRQDGNVPLRHGEEVARRLKAGDRPDADGSEPRVHLRIGDEETHVSIFWLNRDKFLGEMAKHL